MAAGPVVAMVWEGLDAVKTGRAMLGATNPLASTPGTVLLSILGKSYSKLNATWQVPSVVTMLLLLAGTSATVLTRSRALRRR